MKPSEIKEALKAGYRANRPMCVWGGPGVGKSQVANQTTEDLKIGFVDIRISTMDAVELKGIQMPVDGKTKCFPLFQLPEKGKGIILLDEINAAPPLVQAAAYQFVLDRKIGEYELPKGWLPIACCNRETDRAVTHRMPSPLANRFTHLYFDIDLEDWVAWALRKEVVTEVIAFIRFRPNLLYAFNPAKDEKAFPTPRSWEATSDFLKTKPPEKLEYELVKGNVGEGAAAELIGFKRVFDKLPNPDWVLMNPEKTEVPKEPHILFALCESLAAKVSENNMDRAVKFANRLPEEFSVVLVRDAVNRTPELTNTRAFISWASAHSDVLF